MKFTILGSTGFIGTHLCRFLAQVPDADVVCPKRGEPLARDQNHGAIFYCIGMTGDFKSYPLETVEAHVTYLKEVMTEARFENFVYLSSTRIYGDSSDTREEATLSVNPNELSDIYNISKIMGESVCLHAGRPGVKVVRLSNVFDYTFSNPVFTTYLFNHAAKRRVLQLQSQLDSAKDYITIDSAVELLYKIGTSGTQPIYNVASGLNTRHEQLVMTLKRHFPGLEFDVAADAPTIVNSAIDNAKIRSEFQFQPASFESAFSLAIEEKIAANAHENHD